MKLKMFSLIGLLGILLVSGFACGEGQSASPTPTPTPSPTYTLIATPTASDLLIVEAQDNYVSFNPCEYEMVGYIRNIGSVKINHVKVALEIQFGVTDWVEGGTAYEVGSTHMLDLEPGQVKEFSFVHVCPECCYFVEGQKGYLCQIFNATCLPYCEGIGSIYNTGCPNPCRIRIGEVQ